MLEEKLERTGFIYLFSFVLSEPRNTERKGPAKGTGKQHRRGKMKRFQWLCMKNEKTGCLERSAGISKDLEKRWRRDWLVKKGKKRRKTQDENGPLTLLPLRYRHAIPGFNPPNGLIIFYLHLFYSCVQVIEFGFCFSINKINLFGRLALWGKKQGAVISFRSKNIFFITAPRQETSTRHQKGRNYIKTLVQFSMFLLPWNKISILKITKIDECLN